MLKKIDEQDEDQKSKKPENDQTGFLKVPKRKIKKQHTGPIAVDPKSEQGLDDTETQMYMTGSIKGQALDTLGKTQSILNAWDSSSGK